MDARLREYADRWRDAAPTAPPVDGARLESQRPMRRAWWLAGLSAAAIAVAILSGTLLAGHDPSATPAGPSTGPTVADAAQRKAAVRTGVPVIQGFLNTSRRDGFVVAARKYLPADSQPESAVGVPRLASGSVVTAEMSSWE